MSRPFTPPHDPTCDTHRLQETIRAKLIRVTEAVRERDTLVADAVAAGIPKREVHAITGLARTTIDRIIADDDH